MILGNLAEHLQRIEPHINALQLQRIINLSDHDTLDINGSAVRGDLDLFSLTIPLLAHIHTKINKGRGIEHTR